MIHYMSTQGVGDPWVGIELQAVRQAGLPARLHALNAPKTTGFTSPDFQAENRATNVLSPLSRWRAALAVLAAPVRFGPRRALGALWTALTGPRESLRTRAMGLWHYAVACHWAAALRGTPVSHIHSQGIHSGGTVAMYGAWLLDVPFSFTSHAADPFRNRAALADMIRRARFIVCISEFHRQFFLDNGARPDQLQIGHRGIDVAHVTPRRRTRAPGEPLHILSSGRLVDKKGFHVLIGACALLAERGFAFHCTIGGSGPEAEPLRALIAEKGLGDHVTLKGTAITQEDLPCFIESGDVYCLPCDGTKDNDVDGLPVMLMEAMACGLPAVSTELIGIPDLIEDGETGLLVPAGDAAALADALVRLGEDAALAERLARAGRDRVMAQFNVATCLAPTIDRFRASLAATGGPNGAPSGGLPRYLFVCADSLPNTGWASGGTAVLYQMVAELRRQGHDAAMLHGDRRARYSGAQEAVPIFANYRLRSHEMKRRGRRRRLLDALRWQLGLLRGGAPLLEPGPGDVIVVAEYMMADALAAFPGQRMILISQNPFSHMEAHSRAAAWHPDPAGAFTHTVGISELCIRVCNLLGYRAPAYVPVSMWPERFPFRAQKDKVVALMPRKRPDEAQVIARALETRGKLRGYRLDPIDGVPLAEVAARMAQARIFISLQSLEGLGFPAAEAMATGCLVVGYTGLGADEYFDTTTGIPIAEGDTAALVQAVEEVIAEYEDSPERLEAMRRHASEVVNRRYSSEAFLSSLIATWAQIDADLSGADPVEQMRG